MIPGEDERDETPTGARHGLCQQGTGLTGHPFFSTSECQELEMGSTAGAGGAGSVSCDRWSGLQGMAGKSEDNAHWKIWSRCISRWVDVLVC